MKYLTSLFLLIPILAFSQTTKREKLSLEDIYLRYSTYPSRISGLNHMDDGKHYSVNEGGVVAMYDYEKGERSVLFNQEDAKEKGMEYSMSGYEISGSGNRLLIETNVQSIYRRSKKATYYIWNFESKELFELFDGKQVLNATLSPDEKKVAFVFENNMYIQDINSQAVTQMTDDGEENKIINGLTDWVYEEEFAIVKAFEWSPNSDMIAFLKFDESEVKEYKIPVYRGNSYPDMYTYKYPKAGEDNSVLSLHVFDLSNEKTQEIDLGEETDIYIPRIAWANRDELTYQKFNRLQNHFWIISQNVKGNKSRVIYEEQSETYIDVNDDLTFLDNGKSFIISSEKSGFNHLYHYRNDGKLISQITEGDYDVTSYLGYHKSDGRIYYESAEESPLERHIYSIKLNGRSKKQLLKDSGTHSASFSDDYSYYIHTFSNITTPPYVSIRNHRNKVVRVLQDNEAFKERMAEYDLPQPEFVQAEGADGTMLNGWEIKPENFDKNKEYPMLMFLYGGPGSQTVQNKYSFSNRAWFQYLAKNGYYVISYDNRGTGARGRDFKNCTYKRLGELESADQIAIAETYAKKPFIDDRRIGMFGWSYGGFMTTLCVSKSDVFDVGVAVAPVSDWRYYDNIYTERYMQRPQDNEKGYKETSVIDYLDGLRDKEYLLVHGSFDDNVHPQNAFEIMNTLVSKNISFDSEIYVNKNHGIYGGYTRIHLFKKITEFLDKNLMGI